MGMYGRCGDCKHCCLENLQSYSSQVKAINGTNTSEQERKRRIEAANRTQTARCGITDQIVRPGYNCKCGKFYADSSKVSPKEYESFLKKLEMDKRKNPQDYDEDYDEIEETETITEVKERKTKKRPESFAAKSGLTKFIVCIVSAALIIIGCFLSVYLVATSGGPSKEAMVPFIGTGITLCVIFTIIDLIFFRDVTFSLTSKVNDLYHDVSDTFTDAIDIGFNAATILYWIIRALLWISYPFVQFLLLLFPSPIMFSVGLSENSAHEDVLKLGLGLMMSVIYGTFVYFIFAPIIEQTLISILVAVGVSLIAFTFCANTEIMCKIAYIGLCISKYPYKAFDKVGGELTRHFWTFLIGLIFLPLSLVFMVLQPITAILAVIICGPFVFIVYFIIFIVHLISGIIEVRGERVSVSDNEEEMSENDDNTEDEEEVSENDDNTDNEEGMSEVDDDLDNEDMDEEDMDEENKIASVVLTKEVDIKQYTDDDIRRDLVKTYPNLIILKEDRLFSKKMVEKDNKNETVTYGDIIAPFMFIFIDSLKATLNVGSKHYVKLVMYLSNVILKILGNRDFLNTMNLESRLSIQSMSMNLAEFIATGNAFLKKKNETFNEIFEDEFVFEINIQISTFEELFENFKAYL